MRTEPTSAITTADPDDDNADLGAWRTWPTFMPKQTAMKVREMMTRDVTTCRFETNLAQVVKLLWEQDCGVLPVVTSDGKVSGMITDRDVCVALATRGQTADRIAVHDVIAETAYTCSVDDDAMVALKTMKSQRVRRLPVVDAEGRLKGILSLNDVMMHAGAASPTEIVSTMASICEHRRPAMAGAGPK
jgi:CBS domain-containing protein